VAYGADGTARDETEVFTHALERTAPPPRPSEASDPLARPEATAVRVMSWNVEFARILETPAPFARCLRAVAPDIVLFQELKSDSSTGQLAALLEEAVPTGDDGAWTVVLGEGGGGLRCGVATRLPAKGAEGLRVLPMPGSPDRTVRVAAIVAQVHGRPLLAASCHLKCCGRLGGREDATRMTEVETIAAGIAATRSAEGPEAIIVGGDLNLVGGRGPLERLGRGTDIDGSDLAIVEPLQIDGRTNATWEDPGQPFIPGRLDYLLHGDAGTRVVGTFVLDTRDLSEASLRRHDLRSRDALASDHLPIVVDLAWGEEE
jgi:endonuclease/exonuclease/phosphatase family metal-dependent hydrolase